MASICNNILLFLMIVFMGSGCESSLPNEHHETQCSNTFLRFETTNGKISVDTSVAKLKIAFCEKCASLIKSQENDFVFDFKNKILIRKNGQQEDFIVLDRISVMSKNEHELEIRKYAYGLGKIDGLRIFGLDSNNCLMFIHSSTWGDGLIRPCFFEQVEEEDLRNALKLDIPIPPPPPTD